RLLLPHSFIHSFISWFVHSLLVHSPGGQVRELRRQLDERLVVLHATVQRLLLPERQLRLFGVQHLAGRMVMSLLIDI
ncbi:unnamed protein product, partial [Plutella xylostella]